MRENEVVEARDESGRRKTHGTRYMLIRRTRLSIITKKMLAIRGGTRCEK